MNRRLLCRLLRKKGHACDEAEDGSVSLELFKKSHAEGQPYDSVLMDFEMPVMNGPEATRQIRNLDYGGDVSVIGVTENVLPDGVAPHDTVLAKPLKLTELDSIWRASLSSSESKAGLLTLDPGGVGDDRDAIMEV